MQKHVVDTKAKAEPLSMGNACFSSSGMASAIDFVGLSTRAYPLIARLRSRWLQMPGTGLARPRNPILQYILEGRTGSISRPTIVSLRRFSRALPSSQAGWKDGAFSTSPRQTTGVSTRPGGRLWRPLTRNCSTFSRGLAQQASLLGRPVFSMKTPLGHAKS